ncbi:MAG TPA: hypothetical protein VFI23_12480 [Rhizomicrobium sp.]|nr:hypothetical protein [Rhizomicrobium sp.]
MISFNLITVLCLLAAVAIVGVAFVWALLEARQDGPHRKKRRLIRHLKSHKPSLGDHGR